MKKNISILYILSLSILAGAYIGCGGQLKSEVKDTLPQKSASFEEKSYKNYKIAFQSNRDWGNLEIYVMNADGSEQKRLTHDRASDGVPSWSPDGRKIAFQCELYDKSILGFNWEIYVMNADGSERKNLTNNPGWGFSYDDTRPSWSPDCKKIAFQSYRFDPSLSSDNNWEIYVMNADGSNQRNLTKNPRHDWYPTWSPEGKKIAFQSIRDGNWEIYVMNADGSEQKRLTYNSAKDIQPSWSPDGSKIAFVSSRDGGFLRSNLEIYVMNVDGSEQKRLTHNPGDDASPSWSPDGKKIAFHSNRRKLGFLKSLDWDIYVMNADGSERKRLTNTGLENVFPSWSPFLKTEK